MAKLLLLIRILFFLPLYSLAAVDFNVELSNNVTQLNPGTVVAKPEDYYLLFAVKNIDDIPDYNEVYLIILIILKFSITLLLELIIHVSDYWAIACVCWCYNSCFGSIVFRLLHYATFVVFFVVCMIYGTVLYPVMVQIYFVE